MSGPAHQRKQKAAHQVNNFGSLLGLIITPRLTPQPVLREGLDAHLMDHVVGEVLRVEGKRVDSMLGGVIRAVDKTETLGNHSVLLKFSGIHKHYMVMVPGLSWRVSWGPEKGLGTAL